MATQLDDLTSLGYVFRYEVGFAAVPAGGSVYIGVQTLGKEVVVLARSYGSTGSVVTAELHEASYSGGMLSRRFNRRLSSTRAEPLAMRENVTPGALGNPITSATLRAATATGAAALAVSGDESKIYLKANTQYVVKITNGHNSVADIGASFDMRRAVEGTALEE